MFRLLIIGLTALLLMNCASIAPSPSSQPAANTGWNERQAKLSPLSHWQLTGKIAIVAANDSGSASVDWTENQDHFRIAMLGPLGSDGITLVGTPHHVTLDTASGKHFAANSAEALLATHWGWHLPVSYLRYWVRGLPVPGVPATSQFDSHHRLISLTQQGWQIQYLSYTTTQGIELPQRIVASSANLKAKLMIYAWNLSIAH